MRVAGLALLGVVQATAVFGEGFAYPSFGNALGVSRLFSNDFLGDGKDRWRTGSYEVSVTFGDDVRNGLPDTAFELMQYRLRAEILAPEDLSLPTAFPDRPYAGVLALGAFTHYEAGAFNVSYGGELVMVGESTGLGDFQTWAHEKLSVQTPQMLADQLPDRIYPTVQGEVSRDLRFGNTMLRPFVEGQAGIETYARVGFDALFGANYSRNFFVRDPVTGHLVSNVRSSDNQSFGFVLGGDVAYVADSKLLPDSRGYTVRKSRPRARAGFAYEGKNAGIFYGLTWLGKEFVGQQSSQVTGSLNVKMKF